MFEVDAPALLLQSVAFDAIPLHDSHDIGFEFIGGHGTEADRGNGGESEERASLNAWDCLRGWLGGEQEEVKRAVCHGQQMKNVSALNGSTGEEATYASLRGLQPHRTSFCLPLSRAHTLVHRVCAHALEQGLPFRNHSLHGMLQCLRPGQNRAVYG